MNLYNRYTKLKNIFMYKKILKHICVVFIFGIMGCHPQKEVKNIDLTELTIADIHKAYQEGRYNSQQLVSAYLARIEQQDQKLNAITIINPEALPIARTLDEEYKKQGYYARSTVFQ